MKLYLIYVYVVLDNDKIECIKNNHPCVNFRTQHTTYIAG